MRSRTALVFWETVSGKGSSESKGGDLLRAGHLRVVELEEHSSWRKLSERRAEGIETKDKDCGRSRHGQEASE